MGRRPMAMLPALGLAALLAGCPAELPPEAPRSLPTEIDLPYGVNRDCGCLRDGECVLLDEIPGHFEIRNLDCRWLTPHRVAQCRFEARFVELYFDRDGGSREEPGDWRRQSLRVVALPVGSWCAG